MVSQRVIGQALGLLMVRMDSTADEAFRVLVGESQHRNVKLRDVVRSTCADTTATDDLPRRHRPELW